MGLIHIIGLFVALIQLGCAHHNPNPWPLLEVNIDSLRGDTSKDKRDFIIVSGKAGVETTDLQFKEFSRYVTNALDNIGYERSSDPRKAGIVVFLNYGIGAPKTTYYSYSYPVYGFTGGGATKFTATTRDETSTKTVETEGEITQTPEFGVVGTRSRTESKTTYDRYIILEAASVARLIADQEIEPVWRTTITSTGASNDFRTVFPILLAAGQPYISRDTGKLIQTFIRGNDRAIFDILGGAGRQ
jgi:hypothetical protein